MNVLTWIPSEHDATSFYRALQPLAQLRKIYPKLRLTHIAPNQAINMIHLADVDVLFFQRPTGTNQLAVMQACKNLGIKTWVEYDDDLFCIPTSNPAANQVDAGAKKVIQDLLNGADIISVSTKQLGMNLQRYLRADNRERKIYVIPNALNDYLFKDKPVFRPHNMVAWRGTQSHQGDLYRFAPAILSAARANPNWFFSFIGYNPFFIVEELKNQGAHTDGMEIFEYHHFLKKIYPNLMIVLLSDSEFNRCKSNIAWIEGTYAGGVTLAPNLQEWRKPGIVTYGSVTEFGETLNEMLHSGAIPAGEKMHALSWEYIMDKLRLSQVNKLRVNLLEEVMSS